jgi:glycosyltransferase involved in cell wall biosynthesis
MKVIIDISPLRSKHKTRGIGMYTRRLIDAIRKLDKKNTYVLTTKTSQVSNADIIHYPYFDLYFHTLPLRKKAKTVLTIHDVIPLIFTKDFSPGIRGKIGHYLQRAALRNVSAIITDSENSKKDIKKLLGVADSKINVIYLAADKVFFKKNFTAIERVKKKYKLPEKFALYVGDINENKNLLRLIEAFYLVEKRYRKLYLVMVGKAFVNKKIPQMKLFSSKIVETGLEDKILTISNVPLDPADDLAAIFRASTLYAQPSLYEGFGLPVLEAMASGTPVMTSDTSSIPEIINDSAISVNPRSVTDIAQAMMKILNFSQESILKVRERGIKQAKKFSWEKTASQTIGIYKKVLEDH